MLSDFHSFLETYAQGRNFKVVSQSTPEHVTLKVAGHALQVVFLAERGLLLFQSAVGILPEDGDAKQAMFARLLAANNIFSATEGFTLGCAFTEGLVTLQFIWPFEGMTSDAFANIADKFLAASSHWMVELNRPDVDAHADAPSEVVAPISGDFIRV